MGLFLKKRVEMPDKIILGNTEFVFDRKLGFHVGEWTVWDRKTKILLEFQSTEGNIGDIVLEKVNWVNDHKDTIIRAFLDENDDCIDVVNEMIEDGTLEADGKISEDVILSRLVNTFISRISLTMLPVPNSHNTVCVLSGEEARHWQSRSSGYSSS